MMSEKRRRGLEGWERQQGCKKGDGDYNDSSDDDGNNNDNNDDDGNDDKDHHFWLLISKFLFPY
jgi:hypothetical protein